MEHILFSCTDSGHAAVWQLVHGFLHRKRADVKIDIGTMWGCAMARLTSDRDSRDKGLERAFRIMISKSVYLIWKLRCEKRIQQGDDTTWCHSRTEVQSRRQAMMRTRIARDSRLLNTFNYGSRAIDPFLHEETWRDVADNNHHTSTASPDASGVLVGIGTAPVAQGVG
ncbi:hypothetical protein AURDEDRAFT_61682 [Auricularia subglabra TFB-10046 SS5]|nr:hypothetical protein AURDEDRAFT_61682 [Auricularia subglabra TFB-10046 SS5]